MKKVLKITAIVLVVSLLTAGITVFAGGFGKKGIYPESLSEEQKVLVLEKFNGCISEMVEAGEITKEQGESISVALKKSGKSDGRLKKERPEGEKMPEMTEEQKTEMKEKYKAGIAEKLEKGEITQEEYNELVEKAENGEFGPRGMGKGKPGGNRSKGEKPAEKPTEE